MEAAERIAASKRQSKRLANRYQKRGARGLVHGSWIKLESGEVKEDDKKLVRLIREKYSGQIGECFGPLVHRRSV